jgi:hypothetical protein
MQHIVQEIRKETVYNIVSLPRAKIAQQIDSSSDKLNELRKKNKRI